MIWTELQSGLHCNRVFRIPFSPLDSWRYMGILFFPIIPFPFFHFLLSVFIIYWYLGGGAGFLFGSCFCGVAGVLVARNVPKKRSPWWPQLGQKTKVPIALESPMEGRWNPGGKGPYREQNGSDLYVSVSSLRTSSRGAAQLRDLTSSSVPQHLGKQRTHSLRISVILAKSWKAEQLRNFFVRMRTTETRCPAQRSPFFH